MSTHFLSDEPAYAFCPAGESHDGPFQIRIAVEDMAVSIPTSLFAASVHGVPARARHGTRARTAVPVHAVRAGAGAKRARVLFRRLFDDRSPGLFRAMGTRISHGVR